MNPQQAANTLYTNATANRIIDPGAGSPNRPLLVAQAAEAMLDWLENHDLAICSGRPLMIMEVHLMTEMMPSVEQAEDSKLESGLDEQFGGPGQDRRVAADR